jgi:3-oxoacyl-[acyl-carrier protein] reductase
LSDSLERDRRSAVDRPYERRSATAAGVSLDNVEARAKPSSRSGVSRGVFMRLSRAGIGLICHVRSSLVPAGPAWVARSRIASLEAAELGAGGMTANVVAPGYVTDTEFSGDTMTADRQEALITQTMTGRPSTPADVAAAVNYLASPEAKQVTAQILQVNGSALVGRG